MKNDEGNILNMDFGMLMDTSLEDIKVKESTEEKVEETEEPLDLEVNEILEASFKEKPDEEEVVKEIKTEKSPSSSKRTETPSSDPFALVYAKFLLESGSISSFDEDAFKTVIKEEGEAAALQHLISGEIESAKATISNSLEGYQKEYSDLRTMGFSSKDSYDIVSSLEEVENISEDAITDENNEQLRKGILTAYYQETTKFSDDRIKKLVDRSFELGDDVSEAKEALDSLKVSRREYIKKLKTSQEEEAKSKKIEHQRSLETLKLKVEGLDEIIPGQRVNKQTKTKIEEMLTKPVKQLENGTVLNGIWAKRAEDQLDFDIKLAHFINMGLFDGKFEALKKKVKSTAAEELELQISRQGEFTGSGHIPKRETSNDMISSMRGLFK